MSARSGFTLVEVMVSMLILTAGALGVMQLACAATIMSRDAVAVTELGVYAENLLETARDRGFAGNPPGVTTDSISVKGQRYARRLTVAAPNYRTRQIRVDVVRATDTIPAYSTLTYVIR